jgi:hypothetical protein
LRVPGGGGQQKSVTAIYPAVSSDVLHSFHD